MQGFFAGKEMKKSIALSIVFFAAAPAVFAGVAGSQYGISDYD
jgi:hypothetical protein